MNLLEIEYCPFPLLPFKKKVKGGIPTCWDEIRGDQWVALLRLQNNKMGSDEFLGILSGIPRRIWRRISRFAIWSLIQDLEWLNEPKPHHAFFMESLKLKGRRYMLPLPKLKRLSFGQFIYIDSLYAEYQSQASRRNLDRFVASLLQVPGGKFTDEQVDALEPVVSQVPVETCLALALNYQMILDWLCQVYPLIFVPADASESENARKKKRNAAVRSRSQMWITLFDHLAGEDIVNHDRYSDLPFHTVMRHLSGRIRESMRQSRKPVKR